MNYKGFGFGFGLLDGLGVGYGGIGGNGRVIMIIGILYGDYINFWFFGSGGGLGLNVGFGGGVLLLKIVDILVVEGKLK